MTFLKQTSSTLVQYNTNAIPIAKEDLHYIISSPDCLMLYKVLSFPTIPQPTYVLPANMILQGKKHQVNVCKSDIRFRTKSRWTTNK